MEKMNKTNKEKYKKLILLILVLFEVSVLMTLIKDNTNYDSAYSIGYSTGLNFRHVLKIFVTLGIIVFGYKKIKSNYTTIKSN